MLHHRNIYIVEHLCILVMVCKCEHCMNRKFPNARCIVCGTQLEYFEERCTHCIACWHSLMA